MSTLLPTAITQSLGRCKATSRPVQSLRLQRKCACGSTPGMSGECDECRRKGLAVQRKPQSTEVGVEGDSLAPQIVHEVLRTSGQQLDATTRAFMEPRFGHDFSQVRVHTDARAAESARAVNALAYTVGRHVVFETGQYAPASKNGRTLLTHELTHVVQQSDAASAASDSLTLSEPQDPAERNAEMIANAAEGMLPPAITDHLSVQLARQDADDSSQTVAGAAPSSVSRPVFFCSKSVALGQSHAFFRVGSSGAGNPTFELEHDELGEHCPCGIQGWPTRDYPEDKDATDASCIPAPTIAEACLLSNWSTYPIGTYCALGPNSNTYARFVAEKCGAIGLRPPGRIPGFDDSPPVAGTASRALDARLTVLPGFCRTIQCNDDRCARGFLGSIEAEEQPGGGAQDQGEG
jgi:hypothetical protein